LVSKWPFQSGWLFGIEFIQEQGIGNCTNEFFAAIVKFLLQIHNTIKLSSKGPENPCYKMFSMQFAVIRLMQLKSSRPSDSLIWKDHNKCSDSDSQAIVLQDLLSGKDDLQKYEHIFMRYHFMTLELS